MTRKSGKNYYAGKSNFACLSFGILVACEFSLQKFYFLFLIQQINAEY